MVGESMSNFSGPAPNQNPYAAPNVATHPPEKIYDAPLGGIFRDGNLLVVDKMVELPSKVCVLTNRPASKEILRQFRWHNPWIYLLILQILIYIIVATIFSWKHKMNIPLSEEKASRRFNGILFSWIVGFVCVAIFIGTMMSLSDGNPDSFANQIAPFAIIGSIIGALTCVIVGNRFATILFPKKINRDFIWLKGASQEYLAQFPPFNRAR